MTTHAPATERPTTVSVAVAIGWISVILDLVGGIALIALANNSDVLDALSTDSGTVKTMGIVILVLGVILALVVFQLGRGGNVARLLVSIVMLARIASAVYVIFAFGTHQLTEAIVSIAIAVTALALLWNDKANQFFATHP